MSSRVFLTALPLLALSVSMLACTGADHPDEAQRSDTHAFRLEPFAEGFEIPWGMAFLPDGRMMVTEKRGAIRIVSTEGSVSEPLEGVPAVRDNGQGGLLDVALHPDYAQNGWIYLTFSDPDTDDAGESIGYTVLMRARLDGNRLVEQEILWKAPREFYSSRGHHYGSRIVFDGQGHVYFSIGDRGRQDDAQRLDHPSGKVHRLHDDGRIPADNPFVNEPGAITSIWSYGHRNPQGMDFDPRTGALWAVEHGPRGGDELNHVRRGLNYGWPVITYGINYDGTPITDITQKEGMEQPATQWTPSIAVCDMAFYSGSAFPSWSNNLFVTTLKYLEIRRLVIDGTSVTHEEVLLNTGSRVRAVVTGPDGFIYVALEEPGRIARLVPADS